MQDRTREMGGIVNAADREPLKVAIIGGGPGERFRSIGEKHCREEYADVAFVGA